MVLCAVSGPPEEKGSSGRHSVKKDEVMKKKNSGFPGFYLKSPECRLLLETIKGRLVCH